MKRTTVLIWMSVLLLGTVLLWPGIRAAASAQGLLAEAVFPIPFCVAGALLFCAATGWTIACYRSLNGWHAALFGVLAVGCAAVAPRYASLSGMGWICMAEILSLTCFLLALRRWWKRLLFGLLSLVLLASMVLWLAFFGDELDDEVLCRLDSPEGTRYVEVIDEHGQFLGGSVFARVARKEAPLDWMVVRFRQKPERIIWLADSRRELLNESDAVVLPPMEWLDENTLWIDGEPYRIGEGAAP